MAAVARANEVHFRSAFRVHPELDVPMQMVFQELAANRNNSTQTMRNIMHALISNKPLPHNLPLLAHPPSSNADALRDLLLDLKKFQFPIIVCYADEVAQFDAAATAKRFGVEPNFFDQNPDYHAITFRAPDHSCAAIVLNQNCRLPSPNAQHMFAKEIIMYELNHVLTTLHCPYQHEAKEEEEEDDDDPCAPPNLDCASHEIAGFLFEKETRGAKMESLHGLLYLTKPCSSQPRTATRLLTAADLLFLQNRDISTLPWPRKRKRPQKTPKGAKASRSVRDNGRPPRDVVTVRCRF